MTDGNMIMSVAKAMELLQLLNQTAKPMPLTELVQKSGYPKSTVFGLLATMRAYDVVTQTADGKYALGLRLFEFGRQVERSWDISLVARPYMELLTQRAGRPRDAGGHGLFRRIYRHGSGRKGKNQRRASRLRG